jgi:hypothetical protein
VQILSGILRADDRLAVIGPAELIVVLSGLPSPEYAELGAARLMEEYFKILRSGHAAASFRALHGVGLLELVTPELEAPSDELWASLDRNEALGAAPGTRVVFGGCSAGARGALFNLDRVALEIMPALVQENGGSLARVGGLLDSAFWMDLAPFDASKTSFAQQSKEVVALANATSSDASACAKAYPGELWKCIFGQYAVPFLRADFFLHAYQYDLFQLEGDTGVPVPDKTGAERAYCELFRNSTRSSFASDVVQQDGPGKNAGLLPACFKHCNTEGSTFGTLATNGVTLEAAVATWFFGEGSAPQGQRRARAATAAAASASAAHSSAACHMSPGPLRCARTPSACGGLVARCRGRAPCLSS